MRRCVDLQAVQAPAGRPKGAMVACWGR
jgi:hypothetical protein